MKMIFGSIWLGWFFKKD